MDNDIDANENRKEKAEIRKEVKTNIISYIATGLMGAAIACAIGYFMFGVRLDNIDANLSDIHTKVDGLPERVAKIEGRMENAALEPAAINVNISTSSAKIFETESKTFSIDYLAAGPKCQKIDNIGIDESTGEEYNAEDLIGQTVLMPYNEGGQEVYFLGQYNENLHWDGKCILNVYEKNELILITESNYSDGELIDYKQVMPDNKEGKDIWVVSQRIHADNENVGETWNYKRDDKRTKKFDFLSVVEKDILGYDDFHTIYNNLKLCIYYNGNTSDGLYNDTSGNAYYVSYYDDGNVRTLYVGNFINGKFKDDTGKAWYISSKIENGSMYQYYKGKFEGNHPVGKEKDKNAIFENPITQDYINEIIDDYYFKCDLKWADNLMKSSKNQYNGLIN